MIELKKGNVVPYDGYLYSAEEHECMIQIKEFSRPLVEKVLRDMENK